MAQISILEVAATGVGNAAIRPLWVKSGHVRRKTSCPLYPQ